MESFLVSLGSVFTAEMGDRTQLLALMLAARFRRPVPVIAGVLCATLLNHVLAGLIGAWVGRRLDPTVLDVAVGISMIAMALWTLIPDKLAEHAAKEGRTNAFVATVLAFFLAEIGDKTQLATVALAAALPSLPMVIAGTTGGMLLADVPVILLGAAFSQRLPLRAIRITAAVIFVLIGGVFLARAFLH